MATRKYEVQLYTFCDGWINCWTDSDSGKVVFDSKREAKQELKQFLNDELKAFKQGHIADMYDLEDFRIVRVR